MWLTRYKVRICTFTLLLLCIFVLALAWIFPYIATTFCTDINHALYNPKSYNEYWQLESKSNNMNQKFWSDHFKSRSNAEIGDMLNNISKILQPYLNDLEIARKGLFLKQLPDHSWTQRKIHSVAASQEEYFTKLEHFPTVHTIKLTTSLSRLQDVFRSQLHNETSNDCDLYVRKSQRRNYVYGARECEHNPKNSFKSQTLTSDVLKPGLPKDRNSSESKVLLTYLHVVEGAIAATYGDVYTNGLRILPIRCQLSKAAQQEIDLTKDIRHYFSEVFTISTAWGGGFYHWFIESLPRIVPYIDFLHKHPNIRIHVNEVNTFVSKTLQRLGLEKNEVISGNVYADVMYMPAGVTCGTPSWFQAQLQSLLFRQAMPWPSEPRRSIILIKRSVKRYFYCHDFIWKMLNKYGAQYNLKVELFPDNPLPDMETTMKMFNRAFIVVAPHGAGLSNLIYSEPNTIVIEGLKCGADDFSTLCYSDLSYVLGHHYVGLLYEHKQCNWIEAANIEPAIKYYLSALFKST